MRLCKRKYDYQNDPIQMEFILDEKKYVYFYGNLRLTDDDLTRKTIKHLEKENIKLYIDHALLNKKIYESKIKARCTFLKSKGYSISSFEYLGPVDGSMSNEMESLLNNLTSKDDVLLGIHRIKKQGNIGSVINDILTNGLILNGHIESGATNERFSYSDLSSNISYYPDNTKIIKELMYADQHKSSIGSILVEIPDSQLNSEDLVYLDNGGLFRLNPKYIIGFIPLDSNHHLSQIIKSSDLGVDNSYEVDHQSHNRR